MPSPQKNSPAIATTGTACEPEEQKPGRGHHQGCPQQRDGAPGAAGQPRTADPARQDTEVETAHRGGGLGGAQSRGGERFGAEIDQAELDRDADGDQGGQQPAGQRQPRPAFSGRPGRRRRQRLVAVAQVEAGQDQGGQAQGRTPACRGVEEQAEQERSEHRAGGRAHVGFGQRPVAAFAVPVGQDGLGADEHGSAGAAEYRGAEQGQRDGAGRGEQAGTGRGACRRVPQQRRAGQAARESGEAEPGEGRAGRPQRRVHAEHGVGKVEFGPQQRQGGSERVQPERVAGQRRVAQQRRRVPAKGLVAGILRGMLPK